MGLEVFYPKDIIGAVEAIRYATNHTILAAQAKGDEYSNGYQDGHQVALNAILMAFNLLRVPEGDNRSIVPVSKQSDRL